MLILNCRMERRNKQTNRKAKKGKDLLNEMGIHFRIQWRAKILPRSGCFKPGVLIKPRLTRGQAEELHDRYHTPAKAVMTQSWDMCSSQ